MEKLQEVTDHLHQLKGNLIAIDVLLTALLEVVPSSSHKDLVRSFESHAEATRLVIRDTDMSGYALAAFERELNKTRARLSGTAPDKRRDAAGAPIDAALLTTTRINTYAGARSLSGASAFFFRRDQRLFLVTNRHVVIDERSDHFPDRVEMEVHTDAYDLTRCAALSLPLYRDRLSLWRQATDSAGVVDIAVLEIDVSRLPVGTMIHAFTPEHLQSHDEEIRVGDALVILGFPLGFHDTVHHLAVARSASLSSAYGIRFQQQGCFLTDARTHRGSSGSPVLRRRAVQGRCSHGELPWQLLGVHSTRMDISTRDYIEDESLGLNCAWYADVLMTLTDLR